MRSISVNHHITGDLEGRVFIDWPIGVSATTSGGFSDRLRASGSGCRQFMAFPDIQIVMTRFCRPSNAPPPSPASVH
jgi:hypothetical protein